MNIFNSNYFITLLLIIIISTLGQIFYSKIQLTTKQKNVMFGIFLIIYNIGALLGLLFIISPRVTSELKDGWFGLAGGLLFGTIFISLYIGINKLKSLKSY